MDGTRTVNGNPGAMPDKNGRRRRWEMTSENVRFFLPSSGSSPKVPELGQEVSSEGDALVHAFKSGDVFYTVVAWKAVTEMDGNEPRIVKQAVSRS